MKVMVWRVRAATFLMKEEGRVVCEGGRELAWGFGVVVCL